jgi:ATP-dependent DNA ligase
VAAIPVRSVIIDGEAVYCDDAGVSVFDRLHSRAYDDQVILYAFDLLELDSVDQRPNPLVARKGLLEGGARQAGFEARIPMKPARHSKMNPH